MRKLITTTALTFLFAAPAMAAEHTLMAADITPPATDIIFVAPNDYVVDGYELYDYNATPFDGYDDLDDADVYSSITGDEIGDVDEIYEATPGVPGYLTVEVGGFLGIGEKEVLLPMDQLSVFRGEDGLRIYVAATEEQLEEYPDFDD
ncbi:MAG: PRC-barrel domain-containing protein [Pseudomonadota bacterium]